MAGIAHILDRMLTNTERIASKVRGVAAEKRFTQQRIAETLGISRRSAVERFQGRVAFTGVELLELADAMRVDIMRFFPSNAERTEAVAS